MDSVETRTCSTCGGIFPLTIEYYYFNKKDNVFFCECINCHNIRRRKNEREQCSTLEKTLNFRLMSIRRRINHFKNRKCSRIMDYDITLDFLIELWYVQEGLCYYSGIEMDIGRGMYGISIDRVDSSYGYTKDNVVLVCSCINAMKNSYDSATFISLCQSVVDHAKHLSVYED